MFQKCVVCFYARIAMTCAFEPPGNPRKPPETTGNPGKKCPGNPGQDGSGECYSVCGKIAFRRHNDIHMSIPIVETQRFTHCICVFVDA